MQKFCLLLNIRLLRIKQLFTVISEGHNSNFLPMELAPFVQGAHRKWMPLSSPSITDCSPIVVLTHLSLFTCPPPLPPQQSICFNLLSSLHIRTTKKRSNNTVWHILHFVTYHRELVDRKKGDNCPWNWENMEIFLPCQVFFFLSSLHLTNQPAPPFYEM